MTFKRTLPGVGVPPLTTVTGRLRAAELGAANRPKGKARRVATATPPVPTRRVATALEAMADVRGAVLVVGPEGPPPDVLMQRGCPAACGAAFMAAPEGSLLVRDHRDRWWHLGCALTALARVTRRDEDRGSDYHYGWEWDESPGDEW